jgi:hypothetical protein
VLWRPQGREPFPAILLNHGSGRTREDLERLGPYEQNAEKLGPVFARHGYVFLYLFRRGVGLSSDQGANAVDLMNKSAARGLEARNALQLQLLDNREMGDALSALKFLRALPYVDVKDVDPRQIPIRRQHPRLRNWQPVIDTVSAKVRAKFALLRAPVTIQRQLRVSGHCSQWVAPGEVRAP